MEERDRRKRAQCGFGGHCRRATFTQTPAEEDYLYRGGPSPSPLAAGLSDPAQTVR